MSKTFDIALIQPHSLPSVLPLDKGILRDLRTPASCLLYTTCGAKPMETNNQVHLLGRQ